MTAAASGTATRIRTGAADVAGKPIAGAGAALPSAAALNYRGVALHFTLFALYAVGLPALGFRVATFLYVAAANAAMAPPRSARDWMRVGLVAFGTAVVTYYVFERYLSVLLPRGRWTDF